jgi:toxin ParE1/3/4
MSSHKFSVAFSAPAQKDLDGILAYTLITWGEQQLEKYQGILGNAFEQIRTTPQSGRAIFGRYLKLYAGEHVIFYRVEGDTILIIRILHGRMDSTRHLPA